MLGECISSGSNPFYFQKSFLLFHRKIVSIQKKKNNFERLCKKLFKKKKNIQFLDFITFPLKNTNITFFFIVFMVLCKNTSRNKNISQQKHI